ncbi:hypothetical protein BU24DRAFT_376797 [Aaosphaeria arxii CBS 175.79]|uniref:Uncharacterized protein n=1 Tax=Aaosphaeria arxii CBS 175.79 TaxID=1450172 RepID=A0A6A5XEN1_9PLEO|nr:uncharacterized protein BU24DRAFT_376797 [Aaosphaeria arxii CBS 175.79]KAF2011548.1 hypothetical protein BU24DRAFT_376797 [Aaosphaeria arxii CBS 175.79]
MTAILARSPLQSLPTAMNRPTTRRKSARHEEDDGGAPVAKRAKTTAVATNGGAVGGGSNGSGTGRKGAAKKTYDEDDDGFQFTRRTTRKSAAKAQQQPATETIPEEPAKPAPAPARRKKTPAAAPSAPIPEQNDVAPKRRRSTRLSADQEQIEIQQGAQKPAPKRVRKSVAPPVEKEREREKAKSKKQTTPAPETAVEDRSARAQPIVKTPNQNELHVAKKRDGAATKIMLPFADTPVITRNKEMRKASKDGHRRSSSGLRGRRASSLIDSGLSNALPHSEVEVREFYKYIEQSLPEPRRMKQLLTWCGSRALPAKPSGSVKDANAIMAARAIQQELIDDFASKPELSDWFSRVLNERNQTLLKEMEEEVKRLEEEKAAWDAISAASKSIQPTPVTTDQPVPSLADIDTSLLDPSQASILATLQSSMNPPSSTTDDTDEQRPSASTSGSTAFKFTTPTALQSHLSALAISLEPNIDIFADGVHKIEQYRNTAERVADRVLGTAATRLEERDKAVKEKVGSEGIGVGDVLRSLSGVLNE